MLYNAVLIDPDGYNNKSEIELNFPHPKFFCTKETGSVPKVIEAKNTSGDTGPLIIYINRDCNIEEIGNSFKEAGVFLEKLKYHTDYYYVYVMN